MQGLTEKNYENYTRKIIEPKLYESKIIGVKYSVNYRSLKRCARVD